MTFSRLRVDRNGVANSAGRIRANVPSHKHTVQAMRKAEFVSYGSAADGESSKSSVRRADQADRIRRTATRSKISSGRACWRFPTSRLTNDFREGLIRESRVQRVNRVVESGEHGLPVTHRVQLEAIRLETDLFGRVPR